MLTMTVGQFVAACLTVLAFSCGFGFWLGRWTVKYEEEYRDELFED